MAQRRAIDVHALARKDLCLAIERQVVGVFRDQNIGDERYVSSCANAYACFYGEGRSIVATLKKQW